MTLTEYLRFYDRTEQGAQSYDGHDFTEPAEINLRPRCELAAIALTQIEGYTIRVAPGLENFYPLPPRSGWYYPLARTQHDAR